MKLPKFEDWTAPWEKNLKEGDDPEVDLEKLKKYVYDVLSDRQKSETDLAAVKQERDEARTKLSEIERKDESETDRLKRENEELKNRKPDVDPLEVEKLRVALEKGLTPFQAKRLVGTNKEELEADADEILANFTAKRGDDDGEDTSPRSTPKVKVRNPGADGDGDDAFDVDSAADEYFAQRGALG